MITISPDGAIALDRVPTGFRVRRDADMTVVQRGITTLPMMFSQYDLDIRNSGMRLKSRDDSDVRDLPTFEAHFREALSRFCARTMKKIETADFARARSIVQTNSLQEVMAMDPRNMDVGVSALQLKVAKDAAQNASFIRQYEAAGFKILADVPQLATTD